MNVDKLQEEFDKLAEKLSKLDEQTDEYKNLCARMSDLQTLILEATSHEEKLALDRAKVNADIAHTEAAEHEIVARMRSERHREVCEYVKLGVSAAVGLGSMLLVAAIEQDSVVRTKAFGFAQNLLRKVV